jgi:hypothetical protein
MGAVLFEPDERGPCRISSLLFLLLVALCRKFDTGPVSAPCAQPLADAEAFVEKYTSRFHPRALVHKELVLACAAVRDLSNASRVRHWEFCPDIARPDQAALLVTLPGGASLRLPDKRARLALWAGGGAGAEGWGAVEEACRGLDAWAWALLQRIHAARGGGGGGTRPEVLTAVQDESPCARLLATRARRQDRTSYLEVFLRGEDPLPEGGGDDPPSPLHYPLVGADVGECGEQPPGPGSPYGVSCLRGATTFEGSQLQLVNLQQQICITCATTARAAVERLRELEGEALARRATTSQRRGYMQLLYVLPALHLLLTTCLLIVEAYAWETVGGEGAEESFTPGVLVALQGEVASLRRCWVSMAEEEERAIVRKSYPVGFADFLAFTQRRGAAREVLLLRHAPPSSSSSSGP